MTQRPMTGESDVERSFVQPEDALSFFSDYAQVLATGDGITIQIYETIPGPPQPPAGQVTSAVTRLRVTVTMTEERARVLADVLTRSAAAAESRLRQRLSQAAAQKK